MVKHHKQILAMSRDRCWTYGVKLFPSMFFRCSVCLPEHQNFSPERYRGKSTSDGPFLHAGVLAAAALATGPMNVLKAGLSEESLERSTEYM